MDELHCRNFLVCRTIWYDPAKVGAEFSLGRVLIHLRPDEGEGYPFIAHKLFAYGELFGAEGEHAVQV